jgi:histidinol-phosphate phosphatase family domain/HAD-superfamily hydrolase, subfamily IIIA
MTIDSSWTLFLDRDGVINERIPDGYVMCKEKFIIKEDFIEAIKLLRPVFGRVVIVTNQQGIAKGDMTKEDLQDIHQYLIERLEQENVMINAIYYCPHLKESHCKCRKPNTGMAKMAKQQFPQIDYQKSIMIGDTMSDIIFGKRCGMITAFVGPEPPTVEPSLNTKPDFYGEDMLTIAHTILPL